jgi:Secretion system C-terminal sorting domain
MKKSIFLFLFFILGLQSFSQGISITSLTTTPLNDDVNVNLKTVSYDLAHYLSHSYSITGNTINLSICFWHTGLALTEDLNNDFFIPLPSINSNYDIEVTLFSSNSETECIYDGVTKSTTFLETDNFKYNKKSKNYVCPNPNNGIFKIDMGFLNKNDNTIDIFDDLGKAVYNAYTKSSTFDVSLPNLTSGLYFVKLQGDNYNETMKFIKE